MRVLGFMSGTSLDAIDMAILETDGEAIQAFGPAGERKLDDPTRDIVQQAVRAAFSWPRGAPPPPAFEAAGQAVAQAHLEAARDFLTLHGLTGKDIDLVGFHGQTVFHERPGARGVGRTVQVGDARLLAQGLGVPVVHDFRAADVAAGGEGAPLAPIYHAALARASGLETPVGVLNLGGVANITLIGAGGDLLAFDTGPANGMIDLWVQKATDQRYDADGRLAAMGRVDAQALASLLSHPYFQARGPKSLDRYDFPMTPVEALSLEDGAATLTAFTAEAIRLAIEACPEKPGALIACGGGRRNRVLMSAIRARAGVAVRAAEDVGWRGDSIEAEAFAYLAARASRGLPMSFPGTTGVAQAMTGGKIVWAAPAHRAS